MKQFENTYIKTFSVLNVMLILSSFLFVFISIDGNLLSQSDFTMFFRAWFVKSREVFLYLSPFEIIILTTMMLLLQVNGKFGLSKPKGMYRFLVYIYLADAIFYFLNPHDYFYYYFDKLFLLSIVLILFGINGKLYAEFFAKIAKYIGFFFVLKILVLSFFFLSYRYVVLIHGMQSISVEEDFNLFVSFAAIIVLSLFLVEKRLIYLLLYIGLIFFQVLTFRRTGILNTLILSGLLFISSLIYSKKGPVNIIKNIASVLLILSLFVFSFFELMNTTIGMVYLGRFFSAFFDLNITVSNTGYDNNHFNEAAFAYYRAIEVLPFWGVGSESTSLPIVYGKIRGIHNTYVSVWMIYSFGNLLCLLSVFATILIVAKETLFNPIRNVLLQNITLSIVFFLILYFFTLWVAPSWNWISFKSQIFIIFLLSVLVRRKDLQNIVIFR